MTLAVAMVALMTLALVAVACVQLFWFRPLAPLAAAVMEAHAARETAAVEAAAVAAAKPKQTANMKKRAAIQDLNRQVKTVKRLCQYRKEVQARLVKANKELLALDRTIWETMCTVKRYSP